jgi:hypothetical protein|nr:MAG TPA: hypothetical protein [Caudoviricetes sp.]
MSYSDFLVEGGATDSVGGAIMCFTGIKSVMIY